MNNPDATALAQPFRIAALCGSLREHSFNRGLIRAAIEEAPEGIHIVDVPGLRDVPPFDVDVMHSAGAPAVVRHFVDAVREADAIIIATPEYNYGIPGILKNLLDWVSCPPPTSPFRFKPVSIMGASIGNFGTVRAQLSLRQTLLFLECHVLPKPEIYLSQAAQRFDDKGNLTDPVSRGLLREQLAALRQFSMTLATSRSNS